MTVPSNLTSTRFSSLAPTPPAERPAAANNPGATAQTRESATQAQPSLPTGLVGHHVNTTA
ncbi:hypothetical protein [Paraburkholderia dipogonis]|uniref:hypothetical protein n=1 Tax=Paraburkholderia dipogonis TaxID=1211383 RepID=UPI0038BB0C29